MASASANAPPDAIAPNVLPRLFNAPLVRYDSEGITSDDVESCSSSTLRGCKFLGILFSASWCAPCKQFAPLLVEGRKQIQDKHGSDSFEVVLVPRERSHDAWVEQLAQQPWPSLPWGHEVGKMLKETFKVTHLPRLVILDSSGKVLSQNARGGSAGFGFCCNPLKVYAELLRISTGSGGLSDLSDSDDSSDED